jgi:acyl-CoA thioesterase-1
MIFSQVRRGQFLILAVFLGTLAAASLLSTRCEADLPRVLLLGDSISIGYTPYVQQQLAGKADVFRPTTSGGAAINCQYSAYGLNQLDAWLGGGQWDVIHFNWGIWDTHLMLNGAITQANQEYPVQADEQFGYVCANGAKVRAAPAQYRDNLSQILNRLEQTNARLVFATTTQLICRRPENLVLVNTYNQVAKDLMNNRSIAILRREPKSG